MKNLKKLWLERKLSQQKLTENFGITQQAIYNYENGITEPDIYMLKQLADFFHTSVDYLVGHNQECYPSKTMEWIMLSDQAEDIPITIEGKNAAEGRLAHHMMLYLHLTQQMQNCVDTIMEELNAKQGAEKKDTDK